MGDGVTIKRAINGYTICVRDPKIEKSNQKSGSSWRDPHREFIFEDLEKALAWLKANLDKALPKEDFDTAFTEALEDDDDDGE